MEIFDFLNRCYERSLIFWFSVCGVELRLVEGESGEGGGEGGGVLCEEEGSEGDSPTQPRLQQASHHHQAHNSHNVTELTVASRAPWLQFFWNVMS